MPEHIANLIWRKSPDRPSDIFRQKVFRYDPNGLELNKIQAEAVADSKGSQLIGFEWCIKGRVAFVIGCVGASIYKKDPDGGESTQQGAAEKFFSPHEPLGFKFNAFTIRLVIPNFLISRVVNTVPFCTSRFEITFDFAGASHRIKLLQFLPNAGQFAVNWDFSDPGFVYSLGNLAPPSKKHTLVTWLKSQTKRPVAVAVETPAPSAAETLLGLRPERSAYQEELPLKGKSVESPYILAWEERNYPEGKRFTLDIRRGFVCNPTSSVGFLREGSTVVTQSWFPDKRSKAGEEEIPFAACDWVLRADNAKASSTHFDYFSAIIAESGNLAGSDLTARPSIKSKETPSNQPLDIKVQLNQKLGANLTTSGLRLFPDFPSFARLEGRAEIKLEAMRSRQGDALAFDAHIRAKMPDLDYEQLIANRPKAKYSLELRGCRWAEPWKTKAAECQLGSLGIMFGGTDSPFSTDKRTLTYFLRRETADGEKLPWGCVMPIRSTGFQIGRPGTTGFLEGAETFDLLAGQARLCAIDEHDVDGLVDLVDDTEPPLIIPLDDTNEAIGVEPSPLSFQVAERRVPGSPARFEMRLSFALSPTKRPSLPKTRLLYLDRCPFSVAMVELNHLENFDYDGGTELAYWTSEGIHRGWQLRCTSEEVVIWLPPQGLGEGMEKQENGKVDDSGRDDIGINQCAQIRFTPNAKLVVKTGEVDRRYGLTPVFLRLLLGKMRDNRLVGVPLKSARFEMLYGLTFEIRNAPNLRVAEIFSRLGLPPRPVPEEPAGDGLRTKELKKDWQEFRKAWHARLTTLDSRLAVYEVFDDRQKDFAKDGDPKGLELSNTKESAPVSAWLRREADIEPSFGAGKLEESKNKVFPPYAEFGLHGSYAWAFEAKVLYDALANGTDFDSGFIQATDAAIARLYFSALGGWGTQQASFDNGRAVIAVNVEMGRISELRVERIGRIANFWNRAKMVTIFRRTVMGTTQFRHQQDKQLGRPLLRKAEEYVEFLEKHRSFPDRHTVSVDPTATGCLTGCSCDEKIHVDSRFGMSYPRNGTARGWYIPLEVKDGVHVTQGRANVLLHFHSDRRGMHGETTAPLETLRNLYFWTDLTPNLTSDTDLWPPVPDLDAGDFNPNPESHPVYTKKTLGAPAILQGATNFTYALGSFRQACNLVAHLHLDEEQAGDAPQIGAMLRTITVARGTIPRLIKKGMDLTTPPTEESLDAIRAEWEVKRSEVQSFLHVCEEFASGAALEEKLDAALKGELMSQWERLTTGENGLKTQLKAYADHVKNAGGDLNSALESAKSGIAWQLERGKNDLHEVLQIPQRQLEILASDVKKAVGKDWYQLTVDEREKLQSKFRETVRTALTPQLDELMGNLESWQKGLKVLTDASKLDTIVTDVNAAFVKAGKDVDAALRDINKHKGQLNSIAKAAESVLTSSNHQVAAYLASQMEKVRKQLDIAAHLIESKATKPEKFDEELNERIRSLRDSSTSLQDQLLKKSSPSVDWIINGYSQILSKKVWVESEAAREEFIKNLLPSLNAEITKEVEILLNSVKLADFLAKYNPLEQLQKDFTAFSERLEKNFLPDPKQIEKLRAQFFGIETTVSGALSAVTEVRNQYEGIIGSSMETFRAFGRVPEVSMLSFEDMSLKDNVALKDVKSRFQSVAYGFSPAAQATAVTDELKKQLGEAYQQLGIPANAAAARQKIHSLMKDAREQLGQYVDIQPSVKSLVDRAKNAKGEIIQQGRLKAAAIEAEVNQMKSRLMVDAKEAAKRKMTDLIPEFGSLKLEKLMGPLGVSEQFCQSLRERTITTHGFDVQTMNGFVDSKVNQLPLEGEPTLFSFGPVALRLNRPVLSAHLRVNSVNGAAISRTEEGSIRANWQMCFGGTPMVTFRDAELRCVNGKTSMDLDPSKMEMGGLLQAISEMVAASSATSGEDEEEEPFSAGVINELPAGITAFCRLRMTLPDIAAGTFAMTNLSLGAYFEISIRLPALAKYVPPKPDGGGSGGAGGVENSASESSGLDGLNDSEMVDPDLRISPLDGTTPIDHTPIALPEDNGGILGGAYFRIAAGLNISSREAPFNITVFILGGCGWFIMDVEYLVPLSKGKPQMACYLSAGIGVSAGLGINLGFLKGSVLICLALEAECFVKTDRPTQYRLGVVLTIAGCVNIFCVCNASLVIVLAVRYETGGQLSGEGYVRLKIKICWCYTLKVNRGFVYKFGKTQKTQSTEQKVGMLGPAHPLLPSGMSATERGIFGSVNAQPDPERLPELTARDFDHIAMAASMLG